MMSGCRKKIIGFTSRGLVLSCVFVVIFTSFIKAAPDDPSNKEIFSLFGRIREADRAIASSMAFEFAATQPRLRGKEKYLLVGNGDKEWLYRNYMTAAEAEKINSPMAASLWTVYNFSNICGIKIPITYEVRLPINGVLTTGIAQEFLGGYTELKGISRLHSNHMLYLLKNQILDFLVLEIGRDMGDFLYNERTDTLIAIDKELAFLNPGRANGQRRRDCFIDDVYHEIWQAYARREIDIDFDALFVFIDYIQSMDDKLYMKIFRELLGTDSLLMTYAAGVGNEKPIKINEIIRDVEKYKEAGKLNKKLIYAFLELIQWGPQGMPPDSWDKEDQAEAMKIFRLLAKIGRGSLKKELLLRKKELRDYLLNMATVYTKLRGEEFVAPVRNEEKVRQLREVIIRRMREILKQRTGVLSVLQKEDKVQRDLKIIGSMKAWRHYAILMNKLYRARRALYPPDESVLQARVLGEEIDHLDNSRRDAKSYEEKLGISLYKLRLEGILKDLFFSTEQMENIKISVEDLDLSVLKGMLRAGYIAQDLLAKSTDLCVLTRLNGLQSALIQAKSAEESKDVLLQLPRFLRRPFYGYTWGQFTEKNLSYLYAFNRIFKQGLRSNGCIAFLNAQKRWRDCDRPAAIKEIKRFISMARYSGRRGIEFLGLRQLGFYLEYNNKYIRFGNGADFAKAIDVFKKALEYRPQDATTHLNLAILYSMLGDIESSFREFVWLKDNDAGFRKNYVSGKASDALKVAPDLDREQLGRIIDMDFMSGESHYIMGLAYALRAERLKAWEHFQRAKEMGFDIGDIDIAALREQAF